MSGWGSWLSGDTSATDAQPNFHAITDRPQEALYGALEPSDLEWTCAGGFTTETQVWYTVMKDGSFATSQIIHSAIGLWYPQVQITFKYFNPNTGEKIWKSVNVPHFVTPPPPEAAKGKKLDKRSCKGDQFTVFFETDAAGNETYTISANMDADLQIAYSFTRPKVSPGWKLGSGPDGGKSYFGTNLSQPEGYVVHRFWPQAASSGHIILKGQAIDATGAGMFIHAIQGMRPNLVASRWNFANFQSTAQDGNRVVAIMMEFTTTSDFGGPVGSKVHQDQSTGASVRKREPVVVNVGGVTVGGDLVAVTAATRGLNAPDSQPSQGSNSRVLHLDRVLDTETGYQVPQKLQYTWQGPLLVDGKGDKNAQVEAGLTVDIGKPVPSSESKGLIEKVDVLGEIPYMVRKMVNYVAGTKPYVYQYLNPATLKLTLPSSYKGDFAKDASVEGSLFCETTFISEP